MEAGFKSNRLNNNIKLQSEDNDLLYTTMLKVKGII